MACAILFFRPKAARGQDLPPAMKAFPVLRRL